MSHSFRCAYSSKIYMQVYYTTSCRRPGKRATSPRLTPLRTVHDSLLSYSSISPKPTRCHDLASHAFGLSFCIPLQYSFAFLHTDFVCVFRRIRFRVHLLSLFWKFYKLSSNEPPCGSMHTFVSRHMSLSAPLQDYVCFFHDVLPAPLRLTLRLPTP